MNKFNLLKSFLSEYIEESDKSQESLQILKSFLLSQKELYLLEFKIQFLYQSAIVLGSIGIYLILATILWYFLGGIFTLLLTAVLCIISAMLGLVHRKKMLKLKDKKSSSLIQAQTNLESHFKTLFSPIETLLCILRIIQKTEKLFKKITQRFFT